MRPRSQGELRVGSVGHDVRYLQQRLRELGYSIVVDGYFGNPTRERIMELQAAHRLNVNGVVDGATWAALG